MLSIRPLFRVNTLHGYVSASQRLMSTSRLTFQQANKEKKGSKPVDFNPRHLGISTDVYIPPSFKHLPNIFWHPIIFCNVVVRRVYTFGLNTVQVALFRYQSGIKPNFLAWKNKAIESYVQVNQAFAKRKIGSIKPQVSLWVEEALAARAKQLPKNIELEWQLLEFKRIPKIVSVQAMMIPGRPLEHIQLIYKFDTKQRLIKLNKNTNKAEKLDREVVDYVAFLCDASSGDMILIGSVFESKPNAKLPKNFEDDMQAAIAKMKTSGDLYRLPPQ